MYEGGDGVEKNHQLAFYWYKQAALQGDATAQENLADMYWDGRGTTKTYSWLPYGI